MNANGRSATSASATTSAMGRVKRSSAAARPPAGWASTARATSELASAIAAPAAAWTSGAGQRAGDRSLAAIAAFGRRGRAAAHHARQHVGERRPELVDGFELEAFVAELTEFG